MEPSADLSTILNRILDTAADNLRVAKILIQLGLDPNNITFELEIYFQNPQFGYYFLVLTSRRLLENISRLEVIVAQAAGPQAVASSDIA